MLILYHDDFDGAASAAILAGFLKMNGERLFRFQAVDYNLKSAWMDPKLPMVKPGERLAIVDFLFHPSAMLWFDHHETTFVKPEYKQDYMHYRNPLSAWDVRAPSCAGLIYERLWALQPSLARFEALAQAADMIDQARYPSPQSYFDAEHPAIAINHGYRSLSDGQKTELVSRLMQGEGGLTAAREAFRPEIDAVIAVNQQALAGYQAHIALHEAVAAVDLVGTKVPFLRYASYLYYPNTRYSLTMYEQTEGISISLGKNPWQDFKPVDLGAIARRYGGGGHPYAAGIFFPHAKGIHVPALSASAYGQARKAIAEIVPQLAGLPEVEAA